MTVHSSCLSSEPAPPPFCAVRPQSEKLFKAFEEETASPSFSSFDVEQAPGTAVVGPADDDEIDLDSLLLLDTDSDEEENPLDVSGAQVSEARRVPSRTRPRRRVSWARPAPPLTEWPPVPPGGAQKGCGELGRVRLP